MSVALFDLGQRLRAASLARPVPRCSFAPVLAPLNPIAVIVTGAGEGILVQATDGSRQTAGRGLNALSALADLGVELGSDPRTLIVPDRATLRLLLEVARATDRTAPTAAAAAVVGWWDQRADHPGSGAVLHVTAACSTRWVLGVPPVDDQVLALWRRWLGVVDPGPGGLLALSQTVSSGTTLPGLEAFAELDRRSWEYFVARVSDATAPWDWRSRDNRREAALGLATRSDATELYESLCLADPLLATRESFGGTVVSGVVTALPAQGRVDLTLDRLVCRLREDAPVEAYYGFPRDVPPAGRSYAFRGRVMATRVSPDERLVLTVGDVSARAGVVQPGARLSVRPRAVDPNQQRSGRQELHRRYSARRSWLSGGPPPTPRRRDVPLDVVVAAADADV
jgi:hypothetical protein